MPQHSPGNDLTPVLTELSTLSNTSQQEGNVNKRQTLQEVDDNGDLIFRFKLNITQEVNDQTLADFYRASIQDLLKIVRFYSKNIPVIVDAFAFLNEPRKQIGILPEEEQTPS